MVWRSKDESLTLGIETSCDETSAAVVRGGKQVLSNVIASQVDLHRRYGGVVPEIASRRHVESILPVIDRALVEAGCGLQDIDQVAVTCGPGLVGGLLVGISAAKAIAFALGIPLVGVNHVEGHIYANVLAHPELEPPVVCLTVSGGHTDLLLIDQFGSYILLGRTRDDAAGEAFDKVARYVGLGYPGGPVIDRLAQDGDPAAFQFPRGLFGAEDGYDFSFSGVKTAAINFVHNSRQKGEEIEINDFAASFQQAIVDVLVAKTIKAAIEHKVGAIVLSGGVAANSKLRADLASEASAHGISVYYPPPRLCTDNGAMIASAGYFRLQRGESSPLSLNAYPSLKLGATSHP